MNLKLTNIKHEKASNSLAKNYENALHQKLVSIKSNNILKKHQSKQEMNIIKKHQLQDLKQQHLPTFPELPQYKIFKIKSVRQQFQNKNLLMKCQSLHSKKYRAMYKEAMKLSREKLDEDNLSNKNRIIKCTLPKISLEIDSDIDNSLNKKQNSSQKLSKGNSLVKEDQKQQSFRQIEKNRKMKNV